MSVVDYYNTTTSYSSSAHCFKQHQSRAGALFIRKIPAMYPILVEYLNKSHFGAKGHRGPNPISLKNEGKIQWYGKYDTVCTVRAVVSVKWTNALVRTVRYGSALRTAQYCIFIFLCTQQRCTVR